jgi:hypothetical protein
LLGHDNTFFVVFVTFLDNGILALPMASRQTAKGYNLDKRVSVKLAMRVSR